MTNPRVIPFRLSRRAVLRGAGGALVALPALESMRGSRARAAVVAPKRLVVFFTPNGTNANGTGDSTAQPDFWPKATGAGFVLGKEVLPLEPLRKKLLIVSGVNGESQKQDDSTVNPNAAGHGDLHSVGMAQMLTGVSYVYDPATAIAGSLPGGYAGGISVDQHIARKIGGATRFPSLEFGVLTSTDKGVMPFSRMIYSGKNQPVPPEEDPAKMFKRIFTNGTPTGMMTVDQSFAQRKSVLDFVLQDLTTLQGKVSASDRQKLDAHVTAVRDVERRLKPPTTGGSTLGCDTTLAPVNPGDPQSIANFPAIGKLHMDILALALKCDVTRIASLQWSWARSTLAHTWAGSSEIHHDMSHQANNSYAPLTAVNNWYAKQLAYLGQALDSAQDIDGNTLLDNTMIYWCSEIAWGYTHSFNSLRTFILGGGGGALRTGQHIRVTAQPHQRLLVTLMNAMGIAENQFGDTNYGSGPLPGVLA